EADVKDAQGTVHHGLLETLVIVETESIDPATGHLPLSAESFASWGEDVDVRSFQRSIASDVMTVVAFDGSVRASQKGQTDEIWRLELEAAAKNFEGFITPRLGRVDSE